MAWPATEHRGRLPSALIVLILIAGIATIAVAVGPLPDDGARDVIRVTAAVERRDLEQHVIARGVIGHGLTEPVVAGAAGRITAVVAAPGEQIEAGSEVVRIDGRPMVAVEGEWPFWRALKVGVAGSDVEQLQRILAAAGLQPDGDGRFAEATQESLQQWQEQHRYPDPDGELLLNDMLVGAWPKRVDAVSVTVGEFVGPGAILARQSGLTPQVRVDLTPTDRARVSQGDEVSIEAPGVIEAVVGTLTSIDETPTTQEDGSLLYFATASVPSEVELTDGAQTRVSILTGRATGVLAVPLSAIVSGEDGQAAVRVVRSSGVALVGVDLGITSGAWVEVRDGLDGNETVVVAGS